MAWRRPEIPLVGRENEWQALERHLSRAASAHASVLVIEGEAGIGKTRLVDEAFGLAETRGFAVLRAAADELSAIRPFGVFADALGLRRSSSDPQRAALARLLAGGEAHLSSNPALPLPELGWRVLEILLDVLEEMAAKTPVVLLLEDLHWADPSTLLAIRTVAGQLATYPVALIGTLRPAPRVPQLDRLVDHLVSRRAVRLVLPRLETTAVERLVAEVVGAPPSADLLDQVGGAAGNPLYVVELVWALLDEGQVEVVDGRAESRSRSLPAGFVDSVLRRLGFLRQPTLEVLQVAAVLGPTFSLADLSSVLDRPPTALMGLLEEAMAARLVDEAGSHLAFRHGLVQESIYAQLPLAVRVGLHQQVSQALMAAGAPASRVAHHLLRGAAGIDQEAADWLERAAEDAVPHDLGAAADLLARAVELVGPTDPRRLRLLVRQATSLMWAGRVLESQEVARQALACRPEPRLEAELRLGLGRSLLAQGRGPEAVEHFQAAATLPGLDRGLLAELSAETAFGRLLSGDLAGAADEARRAAAAGQAVGNHLATCVALCGLAMVAYFGGDFPGAVLLGTRAVEEAEQDPSGEARRRHPWYFLGTALLNMERYDEAKENFELGRRLADQLGTRWVLPFYDMGLTLHHLHSGDWDNAVAELEAAIAYCEDVDSRNGLIWVRSWIAHLAIHRDDLPLAETALTEAQADLAASGPHLGLDVMLWAGARLREAHGDTDGALQLFELTWDASTELGIMASAPGVAPDLVRLACAAGRRERAQAVIAALEEIAVRSPCSQFEGSLLRCRGLLAEDPDVLLQAVTVYRLGARPVILAGALEDAAVALGRAGRLPEARPLIDEALVLYERAGARRDIRRILGVLRGVGVRRGRQGPRQRPKTGWKSLTETERQVVRLVAEGLTNAKVAERLFISRRTVETHVSHVFSKLGVSSRRELGNVRWSTVSEDRDE